MVAMRALLHLLVVRTVAAGTVAADCPTTLSKERLKSLTAYNDKVAKGDICGGWKEYECGMTTPFASCSADIKKKAADDVANYKKTSAMINSKLNDCKPSCGEGSPAPAPPAKIDQTFHTHIDLADPGKTFTLEKFKNAVKDAVKKATGVEAVPEVVLKAFEIVVQYIVPVIADMMAKMKKAIAAANNVAESAVAVSEAASAAAGGRRLEDAKTKVMDVTITIDGKTADAATKATEVKKSAGSGTASALGKELGGTVTVKTQPKAKAKVEAKVKAAASEADKLKTAITSSEVGTAVGGTVTVPNPSPSPSPSPGPSAGASSLSAVLAAATLLLYAAM